MVKNSLNKEDYRSRLTRKMLGDALLELLKSTEYTDITVTNICEVAQVHRTTFYKHFETKDYLLQYSLFQKCIAPQIEFNKKNKEKKTPRENFFRVLDNGLNIIFEDKDFFYTLLSKRGNDTLIMALMQQLDQYLKKELEQCDGGKMIPPSVFSEYTAGGVVSFIVICIREKMPYTKEKMMQYFSKLIMFP